MHSIRSLIYHAGAVLVGYVALRLESPVIRLSTLPVILALGVLGLGGITDLPFSLAVNNLAAQWIFGWSLHIACLLLERPIPAPVGTKRGSPALATGTQPHKLIFNFRRIPSPDNQQSGRSASPSSDGAISTIRVARDQLLRALAMAAAWGGYSIYYPKIVQLTLRQAWASGVSETPLEDQMILIRRLFVIGNGELAVRAFVVIDFVGSTWLIDNLVHAVLALLFVSILRLDGPNEWPPLFGDIRESYSIRRFWGRFWHRLVVPLYTNLANFVLPLTGSQKWLTPALIFLLSGISHAVATWISGYQCGWWSDILWFMLNFAAIFLEQVLQKAFLRGVTRWLAEKGPVVASLLSSLGYFWTWGFLFWSLPKMLYPKVSCSV